jgi:hypothetical protein
MPLARSTRAALVVALTLTIAACGASAANPSPTQAPTSPSPRPTVPPSAHPAAVEGTPTAVPTPTVYDTTALGPAFDLPLTVALPEGWIALAPPTDNPSLTIGLVKTGHPSNDASQWWGFGLDLVDGASVTNPADMAAAQSDVRKAPWPSSYIDYLVALPGVEVVKPPESTMVGGVRARQVIVHTPPMHPTIFLKGDYTWLGGGQTGIDEAYMRRLIEITVHGKRLLIEYLDLPERFDEHAPLVDGVIHSIAFRG